MTTLSKGYLRLTQVIGPNGPLPISKSTLWARVKNGTFPSPVKLGPRTTGWRIEDIEAFLKNPEAWTAQLATSETAAGNAIANAKPVASWSEEATSRSPASYE